MNIDYKDAPWAQVLAGSAVEEAEPAESGDAASNEIRAQRVGVADHGQRLDRVLVAMAPEFSRSHLQTLVREGLVLVEGLPARVSSRRLKAGDQVRVELRPTAESLSFRPEPMNLPIVHEDDQLIVIDKPAGLVVHPAAGHWSGTLLNGLLAHHPASSGLPRAGIVHRLDKDTAGLMVVGKTLESVTALVRAIAAREVRRTYVAVAQGEMGRASRWVDAPIGRDPGSRLRMAVVASGRPAQTAVEPLVSAGGATAVRCRLHTGRTHQIRVHMAHLGHPLVGDVLYGGRALLGMQRQALHACSLGLEHPGHRRWIEFQSQPPPDFVQAWQAVGGPAFADDLRPELQ